MRLPSPVLFGLGAAATLLMGGSVAYAANGGSLLIGRSNAATALTSLSNSSGTPLSLSAKAGRAPLRVNNATKVTNLNADLLDGIDATSLALKVGRTGIIVGSADDSDGFVNTARCPSGAIATGGGGYAAGTRDYLYYSGPDYTADGTLVPNSWFAVADGDTYAWVVCYNPRGPVPDAASEVPDLPGHGNATSAFASPTVRKSTQPAPTPQKRLP
jgi:hypothetical protein